MMAKLADLPNELLEEILKHCPHEARVTFCLLSRHLNEVGTPLLYTEVMTQSRSSLSKLCRTLMCSKKAAKSVRILSVNLTHEHTELKNFVDLVHRAVMPLSSIVSLCLVSTSTRNSESPNHDLVRRLLLNCHFPQLKGLKFTYFSSQKHNAALLKFLSRHSSISSLSISDTKAFPVAVEEEVFGTIQLPSLATFTGESHWLAAVALNVKLEVVNLLWRGLWVTPGEGPSSQQVAALDRTFYHLRRNSAESLMQLHLTAWAWDPLLIFICSELPNLSELFVKVLSYDMESQGETLDEDNSDFTRQFEKDALPTLTKLRTLCVYQAHPDRNPSKLEQLRVVCRWASICPTLKAIMVSPSITWGKMEQIWQIMFNGVQGVAFSIAAIITGQYPDPGDIEGICLMPIVASLRHRFPRWEHERDLDALLREIILVLPPWASAGSIWSP
ncbi:hypothetical protein HGRIS_004141 [Hohenbuehelia grisea]|uniref:F-box domain-containing protein n=2 Tax=Hohenbuehelia grisea TaxID=104357 RepID=A0ABR3JHT3_9AGAR